MKNDLSKSIKKLKAFCSKNAGEIRTLYEEMEQNSEDAWNNYHERSEAWQESESGNRRYSILMEHDEIMDQCRILAEMLEETPDLTETGE